MNAFETLLQALAFVDPERIGCVAICASAVAPFYGNEPGVAMRLDRAGMYFPLDYYARSDRGAIAAWKNEMAEMTWTYWLTFDGLSAAPRVATPTLFVHSDGCVFPDHVRRVHAQLSGPKELVWATGNQIDFYDQPEQVNAAVRAAGGWFDRTLRA